MFACFPMAMCLSFGRVEISTSKTGSLRILLRSMEWKNCSACGMSSSWLLAAVIDDDEWLHLQPSALHCALGCCWRHKRGKLFCWSHRLSIEEFETQRMSEWVSYCWMMMWYRRPSDLIEVFQLKVLFLWSLYVRKSHSDSELFSPILDIFTLHCRSKVKRITFLSTSPFASSHKWDYRSIKSRAEWSEWTTQYSLIKIHTHELVMRIIPGGFIFFWKAFKKIEFNSIVFTLKFSLLFFVVPQLGWSIEKYVHARC